MRRVHLVEAEEDMGGVTRWVPRLPGLGEWARVLQYRKIQIDKLRNVEFIPNKRLSAQEVLEYGADIVVVATGASWARDGLNGVTRGTIPGADAGLAHVLTPEQVMLDEKRPPGRRVAVYDCEGYFTAAGIAEKLSLEGFDVELVTILDQVAPFCDETLEGPLLRRRMHDVGIRFRRATTVVRIETGVLHLRDEFGAPRSLEVDGIVLVTQRISNDALYLELATGRQALPPPAIGALYRIGDCVAPRLLADAIFDGHRLAREIDSDNPAVPLPHRRERLLVAQAGVPGEGAGWRV